MWLEDAACNKLAELALNDVGVAGSILREAVSCSPFAVRSVDSPDVHKAFQQVLMLPVPTRHGAPCLTETSLLMYKFGRTC